MDQTLYSKTRARRSLWQFLAGKLLAAAAGLIWLLWLVRHTAPLDYGAYVAGLAVVEIFYLVSGLGLSTRAQRYVAEWRLHAPLAQFQRFVARLLFQRLGLALLGALLMSLLATSVRAQMGLPLGAGAQVAMLLWLVAGSLTRQLDEVFPALLMQAASQGLSLMANLLRLGAALFWTAQGLAPSLPELLWLEGLAALLLALAGLFWLSLALRRDARERAQGQVPGEAAHANLERRRVERRLYLVQLLGQAWSGNTARLLLTHLAGAAPAALLGFAGSLADTLRNYLPAYLLAPWLRPLMVAHWTRQRRMEPLARVANAQLKLSLLVLAPLLAYLPQRGDELAGWLSKGRYAEGMGLLFGTLMLWLLLQCAHVLLSMVTATVEHTGANVAATLLGCLFVPVALCLPWQAWGLTIGASLVSLLCLAEAVWVLVVGAALRRAGLALPWDWLGLSKLLLAAMLAGMALTLLPPLPGPATLLALLLASALVLGAAVLLKPLNDAERALLASVLPRRLLIV
ncbi:hypothetical protein [Paucibacter soli]|uniref:hypothetical protein n=1 Tax=Paucibacter soli TaxID=3133433 RepID=UPI0030A63949